MKPAGRLVVASSSAKNCHEAAHALAACLLELPFRCVEMQPPRLRGDYVNLLKSAPQGPEQVAIAFRIATMRLTGGMAVACFHLAIAVRDEEEACKLAAMGDSTDRRNARALLEVMVDPPAAAIMFDRARRAAGALVMDNTFALGHIANELSKRGRLTEAEVREIIQAADRILQQRGVAPT
jgi:hypothetical protein